MTLDIFKPGYWTRKVADIVYNLGNVGIGTTEPTEMLEVGGNVKAVKFIGDGSELTGISSGGSSTIKLGGLSSSTLTVDTPPYFGTLDSGDI